MTETNRSMTRRDALALATVPLFSLPLTGCAQDKTSEAGQDDSSDSTTLETQEDTKQEPIMRVHYVEVVTPDVDAACRIYSEIHGVTFNDADSTLGGARTSKLPEGGMMGIRAPIHDAEKPVTRSYFLVNDIEAAVAAAEKTGAQIAVPPMKLGEHGTCAIFMHSGIEAGLWQL